MFPLRDDIPARRFPLVNLGLILANIIVYVYELGQGEALEGFILAHAFVPAAFASQWLGGAFASALVPVFASLFLHGGLLHILANMWMLWIFGDNVEDSMGPVRYLIFYLLCGVISVLAQAASMPDSPMPMLGASGAISGVLGAYFILYPRARILTLLPIIIFFYLVEVPAYFFLGFWLILHVLQGYVEVRVGSAAGQGGVAWWAHIGGFFSGILLIRFFAEASFLRRRR